MALNGIKEDLHRTAGGGERMLQPTRIRPPPGPDRPVVLGRYGGVMKMVTSESTT